LITKFSWKLGLLYEQNSLALDIPDTKKGKQIMWAKRRTKLKYLNINAQLHTINLFYSNIDVV
jgi:hypothetical protein